MESVGAEDSDDDQEAPEEMWYRLVPLLVLLYEGTIAQVFEYDYAPMALMVQVRKHELV